MCTGRAGGAVGELTCPIQSFMQRPAETLKCCAISVCSPPSHTLTRFFLLFAKGCLTICLAPLWQRQWLVYAVCRKQSTLAEVNPNERTHWLAGYSLKLVKYNFLLVVHILNLRKETGIKSKHVLATEIRDWLWNQSECVQASNERAVINSSDWKY